MQQEQQWKQTERKYWHMIHVFVETMKRDWLDVDDDLQAIISSISNLRRRIHLEHGLLSKLTDSTRLDDLQGNKGVALTVEDVQMALDHDMLQHEEMSRLARTSMANLNEGQEALGRRLSELMRFRFHQQQQELHGLENEKLSWAILAVQQVFGMLANELYRKQVLILKLLQSTQNDIMAAPTGREADGDDGNDENDQFLTDNPHGFAAHCVKVWSRSTSTKSAVNPKLLENVMALGSARKEQA